MVHMPPAPAGRLDSEPPPGLTVPPTAEGCATAVTHLSAALATTGPERSHPDNRGPLPSVELGDRDVPEAVAAATPETGIELRVPAELSYVLVGAPLAYYLGARVSVGHDRPELAAPGAGVRQRLDRLPGYQRSVVDLLRRVFLLDCLVRDCPGEPVLDCQARFDALNPAAARAADPDERLARYLTVPEGALPGGLPEWHLATYAEPTREAVCCLPYLCGDLSLVYIAEASEIDPQGLLTVALDDFLRGASRGHTGTDDVPSVDLLEPDLGAGELHAWLAGGVPIEAYSTSLTAFRNRSPPGTGELSVAVVLNDERMADERETVAGAYRKAARPVELTVREGVPAAELARLFEAERDLVHYIGHCELEGLRCPDGALDTASIGDVGARAFFLNACGSYYQGQRLVENGAAAGAVTVRAVLDRPAATVGAAFARLLTAGLPIERALGLARQQITMSTDYAVVGDGTHALVSEREVPGVARLDRVDGGYRLRYTVPATRRPGDCFRAPFDSGAEAHLRGATATAALDPEEVAAVVAPLDGPVIHEGELREAERLAAELQGDA
jgi:hypothetical protein